MKNAGYAHMGVGGATGPDKAELSARAAISSPLLETSIHGAHGILISITASHDVGLEEVDLASTMISQEAHPDANVIWGLAFDDALDDEMRVTIIATGFENEETVVTNMGHSVAPAAPKAPVVEEPVAPAEVVAEGPAAETAEEEAPAAEEPVAIEAPVAPHREVVEESPITDDDLDSIMSIFKSRRDRGNR
jgi:cell division protein FtsZ